MSSRALRKLQKLREQELQQASLQAEENDDSSEDEPVSQPSKPKLNAFDLLNAADEEDDEEEQESDNDAHEPVTQPTEDIPVPAKSADSKKKKKRKNKKKKASSKATDEATANTKADDEELDEIDRALRELAVDNNRSAQGDATTAATGNNRDASFPKTPAELLAIDPKSLNATNEMRKLFGNVVLENFDQEDAGAGRRRDRNRETIDLGRALTGKYSPASRGQSLAGVTLRRNVLMQGKDEWPRTPSGGLGMELVEKSSTGPTVYRIIHNASYKDVQMQFDMCVESMDPQRMIHLLQYNPYHISTLLQVSEIAKHQSDHAVSADLLERALFNIGRSAHSSFGTSLKEGQARLDFAHMANRELWLVGWRYIANLGMKGTWRTAYEWAKMLLGLNDSDPYCIRLLIDHLALRGREYSHFIELCTQTRLREEWASLPNIQCSLALAYLRLNKPKECREQLRLAMARYPWVFCKLAQELDIQPMPKQIWGKMPPTDAHELLTELYIVRAKDLWNTPEAVSLIVEVADTLAEEEEPVEPPEITLDIARHVVLSDIPKVTTHLPTRFVSGRISASDPLPPYDSEAFRQQSDPTPSYLSRVPEAGRPQWLRDLLDQMNNGAIRFPGFQGGEVHDENGPSGEGEDEINPARPHPSADQQPQLEQWLLADGLHSLEAFLRQYGVDRGNWGEVVDYSPLTEYVDALDALQPETRQRLLHGPIRDSTGEMAIDLLEDELQLLEYDEDEDV
ncbi:transcriptional repressor TCF25-domain-containing protein [Aspergillus pseudonomiae]|uniref:Transcriptional repressor TCF25-domain-containing protein n=1 Tax=Aspergillus pseudonomiae TaxID=1506151 RepID=A0A5N7D4W0_9EURO|nr:transcriptional repressor TCF25-domain-containing protein [Aspergillus pseudonomiae]KAB8257183.1 transcriptional repressor TCF25-domain-containing protein [Aspergillus pseudonomiae]KAE8401329.1 transcriptional repressor TCF25-domain-containing protein [Aspergillus pseudonomiae]